MGQYDAPTVRLPGAGGAPEMAAHCQQIFIVMPQSRRSFVERLDFVTTIGHGEGRDHRGRLGLTTAGPSRIITDLCVMEPDLDTRELTVTSLHPGIGRDQVRAATGWLIRFAPDVRETAAPSEDELAVLRHLRTETENAHKAKEHA